MANLEPKRLNEIRHNSKIFGDAADSGWKALKGLFRAPKDVASGAGGVAGRVVGGTVRGSDNVLGTVAKKTFDAVDNHRVIALAAIIALAWKPVKNFLGGRKESKMQKQLQAEAAQLSIAEQNLMRRQAYAGQENNPGAEIGHVGRVTGGRGPGMSV